MQKTKYLILAASALSFAMANSFAQQSSTPTEDIRAMSERTAVLEARVKELEADLKVQELTAKNVMARRSSSTLDADMNYGTPTVAYVEGAKGSLEAVLLYRGGVKQRVKTGDAIYGAVVQKISLNEVVLYDVKAKAPIRLQFSSGPVTRDPQTGTAAGVPTVLPPGMPGGASGVVR